MNTKPPFNNPFRDMPFPGAGGAYRCDEGELTPDSPAPAAPPPDPAPEDPAPPRPARTRRNPAEQE